MSGNKFSFIDPNVHFRVIILSCVYKYKYLSPRPHDRASDRPPRTVGNEILICTLYGMYTGRTAI